MNSMLCTDKMNDYLNDDLLNRNVIKNDYSHDNRFHLKGFYSYNDVVSSIDCIGGLDNMDSIASNVMVMLEEFVNKLDKNKVYSILVNIGYDEDEIKFVNKSILNNAVLIHSETNLQELCNLIMFRIKICLAKYGDYNNIRLIIGGRVWFSINEIDNILDIELRDIILNDAKDAANKTIKIPKKDCPVFYANLKRVIPKQILELTPYKTKELCNVCIIGNEIILDLGNNKSLKCFYEYENILKYTLYDNGSRLFDWKDYFGNDGYVLRRIDELKIVFNLSDAVVYSEVGYNLDRLRQQPKSFKNDALIGVFDLETYVYKDDGSQKVYSSGFATNDIIKKYYLGDKGCLTSSELIIKMFEDMFDILINKNLKKYTYYAHNLSSFDAYCCCYIISCFWGRKN